MGEKQFRQFSSYFVSVVTVLMLVQLAWEYSNGGVESHHLLNQSDMPSISNWWGLLILPFLAWFATTRVKKRLESSGGGIPAAVLLGFFGMLLVSLSQSIAFEVGYASITMYMAIGVLLAGLFLPIYRAECILGHVLGAMFTFGPVIPLIGIVVIASISAISNLLLKPVLVSIWGYCRRLLSPQPT